MRELVRWRKGAVLSPLSLWLDGPPVSRGLRFVSSILVSGGRRADRALASSFTGRYLFGASQPFLTATDGEPIRLGEGEVRLLPSGRIFGGSLLHYTGPEGSLLYVHEFKLNGTSTAPPMQTRPADRLLFSAHRSPLGGEELPQLLDSPPGAGERRTFVANRLWLALEVHADLVTLTDAGAALELPARRLDRWLKAGGPRPPEASSSEASGISIKYKRDDRPAQVLIIDEETGRSRSWIPPGPGLPDLLECLDRVSPREVLLFGPRAGEWMDCLRGKAPEVNVLSGGGQLTLL